MPANYGSISKAHIELPKLTDQQISTIETLNLFILSQDVNNNLINAGNTIKNNLKTYLSQNRIIGDNIEIRDAFIINISISFDIIVLPEFNNNSVLLDCVNSLKEHFFIDKWQINQPIMLKNLYIMLDKIRGVQTVQNIKITNLSDISSGYSPYSYDIPFATQNDVIYPSLDPSIFEIKFPNNDIIGRVVPL